MHSDLACWIYDKYFSLAETLAAAGVYIAPVTFLLGLLLLLCRKAVSGHFCESCPVSSTQELVVWAHQEIRGCLRPKPPRTLETAHMCRRIKVRTLKNRLEEQLSSKCGQIKQGTQFTRFSARCDFDTSCVTQSS